jgi:hypothetical protein
MALRLPVSSGGQVVTPPANTVSVFIDDRNQIQIKDSDGGVTSIAPRIVVQGSDLAPEDFVVHSSEVMTGYIPASPVELVCKTPEDLVFHACAVLHKGVRKVGATNRPILPLPDELAWMHGAELRTDILYTFIQDVVHLELERFVTRLDTYYELVPKTPDKLEHGQ